MVLLIIYVSIAIGVSFLCSIAEAVLLSVSSTYVAMKQQEAPKTGDLLRSLKDEVSKPLAAILTLNTIAHTVGAAGAGAEAAAIFGDQFVGLISAVLTLMILVLSEIIPKTLGAHFWRELAPFIAYLLRFLIFILYPFVKLSEWITAGIANEPTLNGFSREEFTVMADLSESEGQIHQNESQVLKNLLLMRETAVTDAMTPRTVIFSLPATMTAEEFFHKHDKVGFSRIPIYEGDQDNYIGFVFRSDLLLAQARGNGQQALSNYTRELPVLAVNTSLSQAFNRFLRQRLHMMLVVDEYGEVRGLITLEDVIETLLGMEIIDEKDADFDMQEKAKKLWRKKAESLGLPLQDFDDNASNQP